MNAPSVLGLSNGSSNRESLFTQVSAVEENIRGILISVIEGCELSVVRCCNAF